MIIVNCHPEQGEGSVVILTVFALLIIPASISTLATDNWGRKLWIGWFVSILVAVLRLMKSWKMDVPAAPVIVF